MNDQKFPLIENFSQRGNALSGQEVDFQHDVLQNMKV
jgi:hypothetical protein